MEMIQQLFAFYHLLSTGGTTLQECVSWHVWPTNLYSSMPADFIRHETLEAARWCGGWHHCLTVRGFQVQFPVEAFLCEVCMFSLCMQGLFSGSSFLPLSKNMWVRLIGECERVWLFVSVWSCHGLATCPGCTPPLTQ